MEYLGTTNTYKSIITSEQSYIDYMHSSSDMVEYSDMLWDMNVDANTMWGEEKTSYGYVYIYSSYMFGMFTIKEIYDAVDKRGYIHITLYRCDNATQTWTEVWYRRGYLSGVANNSNFKTYNSNIVWGDWVRENNYEIKVFPLSAQISGQSGMFTNALRRFNGTMWYNADNRCGRISFNATIDLKTNIAITSTDMGSDYSGSSLYLKLSAPNSYYDEYINTLVPYIQKCSVPVHMAFIDGYHQITAQYNSTGGTNSIFFNMLRTAKSGTTVTNSTMALSFDQFIPRGW